MTRKCSKNRFTNGRKLDGFHQGVNFTISSKALNTSLSYLFNLEGSNGYAHPLHPAAFTELAFATESINQDSLRLGCFSVLVRQDIRVDAGVTVPLVHQHRVSVLVVESLEWILTGWRANQQAAEEAVCALFACVQ